MIEPHRFRPDDLRRLATELLSRAGLGRERASAFGRLLLWYDAIGAHDFGISKLGEWLGRLEGGEFNPGQVGRVESEHSSTAVLEGFGGLPILLLARGAEIAGQKARDTGVGIVRVLGLPPSIGSTSAIAADLAIGPYAGAVLGPGPSQSAAFPSAEGVPVVYDSLLASRGGGTDASEGILDSVVDRLAPWMLMAGGDGVLVIAVAVAAFESLGAFHSRIAASIDSRTAPPGWIFPESWTQLRLQHQHSGVALPEAVIGDLRKRSDAAGISFPSTLD